MIVKRTPRECVETLVLNVERLLDLGMCSSCAIMATAEKYKMETNTVETTWIDYNVASL